MCCTWCRNRDWDETLSYETMKVVRVRDKVLGILRILMMLGIAGYIIGYVIIYQKKYMELEVPIGAVAASLQKPADPTYVSRYNYCAQYDPNSYPLPFPNQPYTYDNETCQVWDEYQIVYPPDSLNSLFVTTRSTSSLQRLNCPNPPPPNSGCLYPYANVGPSPSYFMAGVENYTIMIQHSMQARTFWTETHDAIYAGSSDSLSGELVDSDGKPMIPFGQGRDIVRVSDLLRAADTRLGDASDVPGNDESMRSAGIVIIVNVDYTNIGPGSGLIPGYASYQYQATRIPNAEYKVVEVLQLNDTHRELRNRHGLKIVFIQSGQIGRPTFQATLIQLVTSMGLLSVASIIVEMLMLYVMPLRKRYEAYKYEDTQDFTDIRRQSMATGGTTGGAAASRR